MTMDIVLAVNWPPQAPAPGQAALSMSYSSSRLIFPARYAPTASNTDTTVRSPALVRPGIDRAVVEDQAKDIETGEGHRGARDRLVAADEADDAVEQVAADHELDGSAITSRETRAGLHALGPHRDAVRDGDRVELHRRAAAGPDALLHELRQPPQVVVAGHRLDPGGRDPDQRPGEIVVREADGLEHRPGRRPVGPSVRAWECRFAPSVGRP